MKRKTARIMKDRVALRLLFLLLVTGLSYHLGLASEKQQEKIEVHGTVTDASTKEPLPGVTVVSKQTGSGTITDVDGNYTISVSPTDVLQFSFVGMLSENIPVNNRKEISITMSADIIGLDELVVTGYGVQKKSDLTGSIASVSSEKINEVPVAGIDQALQGRAAGVNIIPRSGAPGQGSVVQIRGISSINSGDPLVIIDGVAGSLDNLDPNDIQSIEILKDASSQAIYGSNGGDGVILITTKKGESGKTKTSFNYYRGLESPIKTLDLMNSQQWMAMLEEKLYVNSNGKDSIALTTQPDTLKTYDWQKIVFEPAVTQNYDLGVSGGNEKSNFRISSGLYDQHGIVRNTGYKKITFRIKSEHELTKRITFDENTSYLNTVYNGFAQWRWNDYYNNPIQNALIMAPYVPDYNPDGTWANSAYGGNNPLAQMDIENRKDRYNEFESNLGVKIEIIKGLVFTSRFDGKLGFQDTKEFQPIYYNTTEDKRTHNALVQSNRKNLSYDAQQYLTYNTKLFDHHNITLMVGMEADRYWWSDLSGLRYDMPSSAPQMLYLNLSTDQTSTGQFISGTGSEVRGLAYFGRLNYDYEGKYLVTMNLRRDGRSSFGPAKRFGTFPAVSVGWKFSEEKFMQNQHLVSFGKIRIGYGESGQYPRSGYPYASLIRTPSTFAYPFDNMTASVGAAPVQIANPEIHWESVNSTNVGLDLGLFDNKLNATIEYFKKVNDGMLMLQDVPYIAGSYSAGAAWDGDNTQPEVNIGSIQNTGWEFSLGYKKAVGDFKGSFDLNVTTIKNKVIKLATDSLLSGGVHNVAPICLTRVGGSISEFYGWETDGLFSANDPTAVINNKTVITNQPYYSDSQGNPIYAQPNAVPGDFRFKDVNGDGQVLTNEDKVPLGSPLPKLVFGFSVNLEYKIFDFSAFFNGTYGNKIFNGTKEFLYYYQGNGNRAAAFANRYIQNDIIKSGVVVAKANHNTDIARNASVNYTKPTSFFVEDGSFLRLRSLILGVTVPQQYTQKVGIQKLRFYVSGKNLFTLTKYTGLDPEAGFSSNNQNLDMGIDIGVYPVTRMYLFGVNLEF